MRIILIRHGEPDNVNNTLTERGFRETKALAEYLKDFVFDEAYTSPLQRAVLTSEAVLKPLNKSATVLPWLAEFMHPVDLPYCKAHDNWDFLPSYFVEQNFYNKDTYLESEVLKKAAIDKYYSEVTSNLDELLLAHGYKRNQKGYYDVIDSNKKIIILFCHFGVMSVIMAHLMGIPYVLLAQHFVCRTTGITTMVTEEREKGIAQFRCIQYGSITHLEKANLRPSFYGRFCEIFDSKDRH